LKKQDASNEEARCFKSALGNKVTLGLILKITQVGLSHQKIKKKWWNCIKKFFCTISLSVSSLLRVIFRI